MANTGGAVAHPPGRGYHWLYLLLRCLLCPHSPAPALAFVFVTWGFSLTSQWAYFFSFLSILPTFLLEQQQIPLLLINNLATIFSY